MSTITAEAIQNVVKDFIVRYDAEDFTTPLLKHLNLMLERRTFDVKRGASFEIRQVGFEVQSNQPYNEGEVKLSNPTVIVYGVMIYNDREDKSASVEVTPKRAWTSARAWNGSKWAELPEGARQRVADAVEAAVREEIDEHRWRLVGDEAYRGRQESRIRHCLTDACNAAQTAIDVLNQAVTW